MDALDAERGTHADGVHLIDAAVDGALADAELLGDLGDGHEAGAHESPRDFRTPLMMLRRETSWSLAITITALVTRL